MIDTHCHLNFKAFHKDYRQVYKKSIEAGVKMMIVVGARLDSSEKAIELAQELDGVYASVGVHPYHLDEMEEKGQGELKKSIIDLARGKKVVAIGETGLDYYRFKKSLKASHNFKSLREKQKDLFQLHFQVAKELNLPMIFHCRQAWDDFVALMLQLINQFKWQPQGVFHCFSGKESHLVRLVKLGFYIGFDGNITYRKNENLRRLVKITPLDNLLIETDAPFLTPQPDRDSKNEPAYVKLVGEYVAKIKGLPIETIIYQTTVNACTLFNLK